MTIDAYIGTAFPDAARFEAIPRRRGICTHSPHGRVLQENLPVACRTHRTIAESRSHLLYIRRAGEDQYHAQLFELFERFGGDVEPKHHLQLVAFPRSFDWWYNVADRVQWGDNSAKESLLQWRRADAHFHMC